MINKKLLITFLIFSIFYYLHSIEIEYENTWTKFTVYKPGSVVFENKLFVNAWCAIECYDILADGSIVLSDTIQFNKLIHMIDLDETENKLYIHLSDYLDSGSDWIYIYQITNGSLEFCSITLTNGVLYNFDDLIYPVGNYVIINNTDQLPCYNKQLNQFEDITYPYQRIIGSFDDKLIEYSNSDQIINFYKIENINDPILLFQFNYELIASLEIYIRDFNDSHCMLVDKSQILIFNIEDEQNYYLESIWDYDFNENYMLDKPIYLNNEQLYIGNNAGENFIFNVSDLNSPIQLHYWLEANSEVNWYDIYNDRYLYRSENDNGIYMYDLNDLPNTQYEVLGYVFPYLSTAFIDGLIYKNDTDYLYRVDPETLEEEVICELPHNVGFDYYKCNNLLIIKAGTFFDHYCSIVDLETNQLLNDIQLDGLFLFFHDGKFFIQNDELISIYELNSSYYLEYLTNFTASSSLLLTEYDENHVWVSFDDGDFLFNTTTMQIDHDFSNFFSPSSLRLAKPLKYDDKLIITDMNTPNIANISLYNISNLDNPVLLDFKNEDFNYSYYQLDDYLIEAHILEPARIYTKFTDFFTDPIQTYDFNTAIFDLEIDEENNRIASTSSYYFLKTYTYDLAGNGIVITPENDLQMSNYPNPFNPETIISFTLDTAITGKMELLIYNLKGQKVDYLDITNCEVGVNEVIWNAERFASGIYLYQLKANGKTIASRKCLLLK